MIRFPWAAKTLNEKEIELLATGTNERNPVIDDLVFIEIRKDGKTFPCYIMAIEENPNGEKKIIIDVVQKLDGNYGVLKTAIPYKAIDKQVRFWTLPPNLEMKEEEISNEKGEE